MPIVPPSGADASPPAHNASPPGHNANPPGQEANPADPPAAPAAPARLSQVLGAVLWSFFGVRKRKAMQRDVVTIKAHQVILVGLLLAALLVATLLILVRVIIATAG